MQLSTIDIDFDIHKAIEAERRAFDEPPYVALRRLLKLPDVKVEAVAREGQPWREGLVEVPHGSEARMSYQRGRQRFSGHFLDGNLVVNGQRFSTLSSAACTLAQTKDGKRPSLNGWAYWEVRFPGDAHWRQMNELRSKAEVKAPRPS